MTGGGLCRRAVLVGTGALGAAAVLAGCGGSDDKKNGAQDSGNAGNGGQATPPAGGGSTPGATGGTGGGQALAKVSEVPVGGGKLVGNVLLVQPQAGVIKAFSARCTHQGTIVDPPSGGLIVCPNHGSTFKAEDGSLVKGPATKGLNPVQVKVTGDEIARA